MHENELALTDIKGTVHSEARKGSVGVMNISVRPCSREWPREGNMGRMGGNESHISLST